MIILDIESTGLTHNCGICEIGAISIGESKRIFFQDCRIDDIDAISPGALKVNGKKREELFDEKKRSQKRLIENYLKWVGRQYEKIFFGQNVAWDISMIQAKCLKYGLEDKFLGIHGQRGFDLHTIAQEKYHEIHGKYLLKPNGNSAMNLSKILDFCGIPDKRINVTGNKVTKEGNVHSALEDCKLEGEALMRMKFGRNFFLDYSGFPIPGYLKK